jgi:glycosyltransferase involved in cell wall biosynthesis
MKFCIIIPVYNHPEAISQVVRALKPFGLFCFLINDGSDAHCSAILRQIESSESNWVTLHERQTNGGKGAAVMDGFRLALQQGFSHAIQIDADGQHTLEDLPQFIQASQQNPKALVLGQPVFAADIPRQRLYGRYLTNIWIWINTLSLAIADGMCGFRCYPLAAVRLLIQTKTLSQRMDFDIDIVVRLHWQGLKIINIPTRVNYPIDGVSHFKMFTDNVLISKIHARLFLGMLVHSLQRLFRIGS